MSGTAPGGLVPPVAKEIRHESTIHGDVRVDPYAWLRDRSNPEVIGHLRAEDAHAAAWMEPTKPLQERLYEEMLARIQETDVSVPYRKRGFWYYVRTEEGKQYPILCRKEGSLEAEERITIDMNAMAEGHGFFAIGEYEVSDDGGLLLFSTDTTGYREYTLRAKDLRTGEALPLEIERVSSAAFSADGGTIFYVVDDPVSKRPSRFYRRRLSDPASEVLLHEETDERFSLVVGRTRSDRFVVLTIGSHTSSEVRVLPAAEPDGTFRTIEPRRPEIEYDLSHGDGLFYIRVNDTGRNFRLVTAPIDSPGSAHWREVVPHRPDVMLEAVDVFKTHYVLYERRDGLGRLRLVDLATGGSHEVDFPEPAYALGSDVNAEFETTTYPYRYQSPITPLSVFEHDLATREERLLKETPVLGGYDRTLYAVERVHAEAADGTRVPITLAYRKDRTLPGTPSAMHLLGYGAYGIPYPAGFSSSRVSLFDRGVALGIAHVRGGGEMGKTWHDRGRMEAKANSFADSSPAPSASCAKGGPRPIVS
jgi:Protease II